MLCYEMVSLDTKTQAVTLVEQGFSWHERSVQLGIDMKTVCAVLMKHHELKGSKEMTAQRRQTTARLDYISVKTRLTNRHLTSPEQTVT